MVVNLVRHAVHGYASAVISDANHVLALTRLFGAEAPHVMAAGWGIFVTLDMGDVW